MRCLNVRLVALLCAVTGLATTGCPKANDDTIVVGEVGSTSGAQATFGQSTHKGVMLAADEINAAGGIKGKKIRVKLLDDQSKAEEAVGRVKTLIDRDHVVAVIGEVATSISLAMAPVCQESKVPMISPSSTGVTLTEKGDYIFRVCFIDPFQGQVMAKFAKTSVPASKVAVFRDTSSAYSQGLADAFEKTFKELGGQIVLDEGYKAGDADFKTQLTKIKGAAPDAIFVPGYYNDVGLIAKQARELGISSPLMGGDGWESEKLFEIGGTALDGSYFSSHYSPDDPNAKIRAFVDAFKKKYDGQVPDSLAAQGYDAMSILADALKRSANITGPAVRDAIAATKNFEGITGNITIDQHRNAMKPAVVLKVKNSKEEFVTRVAP